MKSRFHNYRVAQSARNTHMGGKYDQLFVHELPDKLRPPRSARDHAATEICPITASGWVGLARVFNDMFVFWCAVWPVNPVGRILISRQFIAGPAGKIGNRANSSRAKQSVDAHALASYYKRICNRDQTYAHGSTQAF